MLRKFTLITSSIFFSERIANSANKVWRMNSPGFVFVLMGTSLGNPARSRLAPQGSSVWGVTVGSVPEDSAASFSLASVVASKKIKEWHGISQITTIMSSGDSICYKCSLWEYIPDGSAKDTRWTPIRQTLPSHHCMGISVDIWLAENHGQQW